MGLKETIAGAVKAGFAALGNLKESVTYKIQGVGLYVPATGTFTRVETNVAVQGLFLEYKKADIDGQQIKPHDMRFLFEQTELTVAPKLTDRITRSTGKSWEVIAVAEDPAHVTWDLQMRGTNG